MRKLHVRKKIIKKLLILLRKRKFEIVVSIISYSRKRASDSLAIVLNILELFSSVCMYAVCSIYRGGMQEVTLYVSGGSTMRHYLNYARYGSRAHGWS